MPSLGPQPFPGQEKRLRLLAFVRQDAVIRVDKRVEDTAMVWPHLLLIEFIVAMLWLVGLFIISALFNAPLQDVSSPDHTPNPSKAPWYLLNLQELLLHMDKALAGVIVPTILLFVFLPLIPYIDRSREGVGRYFTDKTGLRIFQFSAVYSTVLTFALIFIDYLAKKAGYIEWSSDHLPGGKQLFPNWLIPIGVMFGLSALLVFLVDRLFGATTRGKMIALFTGFVFVYVVLTFVGTSMRGPGMDLYAPWSLPPTIQ
ncbi:MAG: menaquinol-cytochrome C reductase [Chloroflexota bacterium]|nr:menaquinol-cytochrome C reductase [Chloroflexota bacterium]MDE3192962.1 menaquinol-cytochrome C reductase [Chloroflexota bacterium]